MRDYIKQATKQTQSAHKERQFFGSIPVFIKDPLPEDINIDNVLSKIENTLPREFVKNVDTIYVGDFETFSKKRTNAAYENGAIYVSSAQDDEKDMVDDIIHETAHALEERFWQEIYSDNLIEQEFLGKRERLFHIFEEEGLSVPKQLFFSSEYSSAFDRVLHEFIGYDLLSSLTMGLFISPYATTSLSEYFANAYEHYFLGEGKYVKKISPQAYKKIEEIHTSQIYNNEEL